MEWSTSAMVSMQENNLVQQNVQITPLFQPSFSGFSERRPIENDFPLDPIILHNANLMKYIQKLDSFTEKLDTKMKLYETSGFSEHVLPLLDTVIEHPPISTKSSHNKPSIFSSSSKTTNDRKLLNSETLNPHCKMSFLRRSVMAYCLQEGLNECNRHVLDTLTDLLDNFYTAISTQIASARLTRHATEEKQPGCSNDLLDLQKVLEESGVGTIADIFNFRDSNFVEKNGRLMKLSEVSFKECVQKQEKLKMQLVPHATDVTMDSPSGFANNKSSSESFASPMDLNEGSTRREATPSLKRGAPSQTSEPDFHGFFGHSDYVCSNPAKKPKL